MGTVGFLVPDTFDRYHSGRWTEIKEIQIASTVFLQRNAIATAMGESFWQQDSLTTYMLFELWLIKPERQLAKLTSVHCDTLHSLFLL